MSSRPLRLLTASTLVAGAGLAAAPGCQTQPTEASLRALEQSGRVTFVCLSDPADGSVALPLKRCRNIRASHACDYADATATGTTTTGSGGEGGAGGEGGGASSAPQTPKIPHLYALVTQTFRGEIAVIDMTTSGGDYLIDQDPSVPGPSFLPVGASPVGLVSTPGSTATFVTSGEVGREGIYVIPSGRMLRSRSKASKAECTVVEPDGLPPPRLSSWPSCALPGQPGEPILINDPTDAQGFERASCDADHADPDAEITDDQGVKHPEWRDAFHPHGVLRDEGAGRQKLVVPLPTLGGIAVMDAQRLLDGYATPLPTGQPPPEELPPSTGVFASCPIERWIPLDSDVPIVAPPPPQVGPACATPVVAEPGAVTGQPTPAGMAFAGDTLYVADLTLPLIHRLAMDSPCEPVPLPSLLPTSLEQPGRVVTTSRLAATPRPTARLQRFLYANDVGEDTVMVFDISDGATSLTPMVASHPEWTPTQPRDRLRFVSTPRDIVIVSRDVPDNIPGGDVAPEGVFCDPDPDLKACTTATAACDLGTLYRPASDLSSGAGPYKLRGTFAFVLLTNGQVQVVDIEDLDGPCRTPAEWDTLSGCDFPTCTKASPTCPGNFECPPFGEGEPDDAVHTCAQETGSDGALKLFQGSDELTCNAVAPNAPRSAEYVLATSTTGNNLPGILSSPLLFDQSGAQVTGDNPASPRLRATLPVDGGAPILSVNGNLTAINPDGSIPSKGTVGTTDHAVAMNLEDPRAHLVNQTWFITFEGALPRFGTVAAELRSEGDGAGLYDSSARYCEGGVQSRQALQGRFQAEDPPGADPKEQADRAARLADRVQITSPIPEQDNAYWDIAGTCSFNECREAFGDGDALLPRRDFPIREAYSDHLLIDDPQGDLPLAKCCFPAFVTYVVRPGNQWVVAGQASGFLHDMVTDPATGLCRPSCDPAKARQNGRVLRTPHGAGPVKDGDPTAFINPMLRLAIVDGAGTSPSLGDVNTPQRGMEFEFTTVGAFTPLSVILLRDTREIAPVGITYIPSTGELAVTDGEIQGLLTVNLADVATARQFY